MELKNKTILITGASSGIGKACAETFAKYGANLLLVARRKNILDEIAEKLITKHRIKILTLQIDITKQFEKKINIEKIHRRLRNCPIKKKRYENTHPHSCKHLEKHNIL